MPQVDREAQQGLRNLFSAEPAQGSTDRQAQEGEQG